MEDDVNHDIVRNYMDAFAARDLDRCIAMYVDDASLEFPPATYQGKDALKEWHQARFAANMSLVRVNDVAVDGDTVTVDGVITSNRLKAWRIGSLSGRATFQMRDGKIAAARFGLRSHNPLEAFRA